MLTVPEIVASLKTTRTEFARLYLQAQGDRPAPHRVSFDVVGRQTEDALAFGSALEYAQAHGWLDAFLEIAVLESLEDGRIAEALAARSARDDAGLEAMIEALRGFGEPHLMCRGMADAMHWIAKVRVAGQARGTGFLIRPHLLITAWHVLRDAFEQERGSLKWLPRPDAGESMSFEFDDVLSFVRGGRAPEHRGSVIVKAARDWYVRSSACHELEIANDLPADPRKLAGHWDYVIVRLASSAGLERRWGVLDGRAVVPQPKTNILVLQHAKGKSLRYDAFEVGSPADFGVDASLHEVRFLHLANTSPGSSGGPCFDSSFSICGIHQGAWPRAEANGRRANRGVPITRIVEHIEQHGELPSPDPTDMPVWRLRAVDDGAPVLGREDFQRLIWKAALEDSPRILLVNGPAESGKSFLSRLLHTMLPDRLHLKIDLPAEVIAKADAATFIANVCKEAGITVPVLDSVRDVSSSAAVYRKDEVMARFTATLEQERRGRIVWITVRDLNKVDVAGHDARELLLLLYTQTRSSPWLRLVLDGFRGDMPAELHTIVAAYATSPITTTDVERYFQRFAAEYQLSLERDMAGALAEVLVTNHACVRDGFPSTDVKALTKAVMQYSRAIFRRATGQGATASGTDGTEPKHG